MKLLGNILWHFPFMGFMNALFVGMMGLILVALVIPAPLGLGLLQQSKFLLAPFGRSMINSSKLSNDKKGAPALTKSWKVYSKIVMILWLPFGIIFATIAAIQGVLLCISIIGLPVGLVMIKSLGVYLNPVGKTCVSRSVADELERRKGTQEVNDMLGETA